MNKFDKNKKICYNKNINRKKEKNDMFVLIVAATDALNYRLLDNKLNELIESSGCYAFYVLSGWLNGEKSNKTELGSIWAKRNGAPVYKITEKTEDELFNRLLLKADYGIFILDGNSYINNIFMKYKMTGKHGTVIKRKEV